ncbi:MULTISPECIES: hypothetical protein [Methylococcus]|uniref:Uncharacterized protein n=1 Tax=Methylococcus capsulatus TaxID=414 RepID=A0ABZ2F1J5_METCP|nr:MULTISPECIES: hypothetical protein [Methylococcus]
MHSRARLDLSCARTDESRRTGDIDLYVTGNPAHFGRYAGNDARARGFAMR